MCCVVYLNMAAEVRQGWQAPSSVLSSEEVETAEPRLPDAGDSTLSPLELADECPECVEAWPRTGLARKLVKLHSFRNLPPLDPLLSLSDETLCIRHGSFGKHDRSVCIIQTYTARRCRFYGWQTKQIAFITPVPVFWLRCLFTIIFLHRRQGILSGRLFHNKVQSTARTTERHQREESVLYQGEMTFRTRRATVLSKRSHQQPIIKTRSAIAWLANKPQQFSKASRAYRS